MEQPISPEDFLNPLQALLWKRQRDLINTRVLQFLLWTMNEKESHEVESENPCPKENRLNCDVERRYQTSPLQAIDSSDQIEEIDPQEDDDDRLHHIFPLHTPNHQGLECPKEPGGYIRRPGIRTKSGVGVPPRPFKKARYAWEIKNYEHTLSNMSQNVGECSTDLHEESQDSQSSEVNSEGSQEENILHHPEGLIHGSLERTAFLDPRGRPRPDLIPHIMPAPYPTTYGMMAAPPPDGNLRHGDCLRDGQPQMPPDPDPDAGILRWHTRQLCRSIFDNTVNRMLENMGFSPVTERSQGIHPLLVLNLSDDEEREAEEAQQRALENEALTAAMHHKGLFLSPYHYEALESGGTTTDYDSSDDDSDLGDDPVPEGLAHENSLQINSMICRPLPRVPAVAAMPVVTEENEVDPPSIQPKPVSPIPYQIPPQQPQEPNCDEPACDDAVPKKDSNSHSCIDKDKSNVDNNRNVLGDHNNCAIDNTNTENSSGNEEEEERNLENIEKVETNSNVAENENNNDKFFVDQAIEMAIKQQGLGYQQA